MLGRAAKRDPAIGRFARLRHRNRERSGQIPACQRIALRKEPLERTVVKHLATALPCGGSQLDHVVCAANDLRIVLDHNDGIAQVAEVMQG